MEHVIVSFPTKRFVYINGEKNGRTNESLRVEKGSNRFDLGPLKNYEPGAQTFTVANTTVLRPMKISFSKKEE